MASNVPLTGGHDCKFVETPPDKLMCQICLLVARTPHQVTCCGRVYCKACLDEHKRHSNTCPNCRKTGQNFPDIRGGQEIKSLKVKCNNDGNGCGWKGELRSLGNHLTTCGYALLRCTNKCINNTDLNYFTGVFMFTEEVYVLRRDLDNHLKNTCPNRQYQCPHCKDTGRHCEITTTHLVTCPKLKIPCPNTGCDDSVPRCELSDHRTKCLFEKVLCKYAEIGCEEEPLRKDLQQHENDYLLHLQLAVETVNRQQEEIKAMKDEQREMKDTISHTQTTPCVFKMPKFNEHKTFKLDWYSPPFYIHLGSYKMCINIDANGDDGEGTHISVFVNLMRGKNDDNLSWPFRGEVTITLLNQLQDKNHHLRTVMYPDYMDDEANNRVVESDISQGFGLQEFISHDQLGHDAKQNCQYLKDNCLYFRISVETPDPVKPWLTCTT